MIKTVRLKDFAKELGNAYADIRSEQKKVVASSIYSHLEKIVKTSPVDTGLFAQSWDLLETEKSIILGNYAPHAAIVEYGARPFRPPLTPLLAWAKRVLKDGSQPPDYSKDVWALAVYTQKKIEKQGMEPKHILEDAIPEIIRQIKLDLEAMQ